MNPPVTLPWEGAAWPSGEQGICLDPHLSGFAICLLSQRSSPPPASTQEKQDQHKLPARRPLARAKHSSGIKSISSASAGILDGKTDFTGPTKINSQVLLFKITVLCKRRADSSEIGELLDLIQAISVPSGQQQSELPWQGPCLINSLYNMAMEIPVLFHLWMPSTFLQHHRRI